MANTLCVYFDALLLSFCLQEHFLSVSPQDCTSPLGLTDGTVENSQLSALSYYQHFSIGHKTVSMKPEFARLNSHLAWCGSGKLQGNYIAVDFLQTVNVSAIATQGFLGVNKYYVKTYKVTYSTDGTHWQDFGAPKTETVWRGNSDDKSIVKNMFPSLIIARYVRVYPLSYSRHVCIRMELYGCRNYASKKNPVPGSTPTVLNSTVYNKSRTSGSPQPPTTVFHSPVTSKKKPDQSGTPTVSTPSTITSPGLSSVVVLHSSGKETTTSHSSTVQAESPSTEPLTEQWTSSPSQHPVVDGQIASQSSDKGKHTSPGTVIIVLLVIAAVLIVIGIPLLMVAVFHRHKRNKRKRCQNGRMCMYDVRLSEVDSCLCNKEIDECAVPSAMFGTDESHLLDGSQPCAV